MKGIYKCFRKFDIKNPVRGYYRIVKDCAVAQPTPLYIN